MIEELVSACEWGANPYVFFSTNVFSPLIYYSHLTPVLVALILGLYIYFSNRNSLLNKILLFNALALSVWLILDLILWATDSPRIVMVAWSIVNMIEPAIYAGFLYFVLVFVGTKDVSLKSKIFIALPLLPSILLGGTHWNILGFNLTNCDREVIEGPLAYYNYVIEVFYVFWIVIVGLRSFISKQYAAYRTQSILLVISILVLLLGFSSGNIAGTFTEDWAIGQYGLFVIPVSIGVVAYFVIRLKFLNQSEIMAAQVLVLGLLIAVASILFIQDIQLVRWIVSVTLVFLAVLGFLLLRSFTLEIKQRKQIEILANQLQKANDNQVTLIHFITHQIKGFVTKSRNIFSMALEGDFGPVGPQLEPMLKAGLESDTKGVATIQEILNASNIKSGKVAYAMVPLDIHALLEEVIQDLSPAAVSKGISLVRELGTSVCTLQGDEAQLTNAFKNLIDNSIKYTPKGEVHIKISKAEGKVLVTIADTGVGITEEDMRNLFTEGGHGKNSTKVNVESTGFGLYIVKNIIEAHKGRVWAESEGAGKGTRFIVSLPA